MARVVHQLGDPGLIDWPRFANNDHVVTAQFLRQLTEAYATILGSKTKLLLAWSVADAPLLGGANYEALNIYFRSSRRANALDIRTVQRHRNLLAGFPSFFFRLTKVSDSSVVDSDEIFVHGRAAGSLRLQDASDYRVIMPIDPSTEYTLAFHGDVADPLCLTVHERGPRAIDDANLPDPSRFAIGQKVAADDVEKLLTLADAIRADCAKHLFNFSAGAFAYSTTSATASEVVSQTSGYGTDKPYFAFDLTRCGTLGASTVTVTFAFLAEKKGGSGSGFVSVVDANTGTTLADVEFVTADGKVWKTTTVDFSLAVHRVNVMFRATGGTMEFFATSAFLYG
jgi:hypothetical protein